MDLRIFKYIGLGLVGLGGLSTAIYFGVTSISENKMLEDIDLDSSDVTENSINEDLQYQFLYKLAKKVFPYLKGRNSTATSGTKAVGKDMTLISWLASEFGQTDHPTDDKWENFKSLCELQKPKDLKVTPKQSDGSDNVKVPASRVCYVDKGKGYDSKLPKCEKGALGLWESDTPGYNGFTLSGGWYWSNLILWEYFRDKHPTASPLDKFDEWYQTQTEDNSNTKTSGIKGILEKE